MNQNTVTGDYININLRQLGATSIKEFNSIMQSRSGWFPQAD